MKLEPNIGSCAESAAMQSGCRRCPKCLLRSQCGMRVLALSTITNIARPDAPRRVDAHEVIDVASHAEPRLRQIVRDVVRMIG